MEDADVIAYSQPGAQVPHSSPDLKACADSSVAHGPMQFYVAIGTWDRYKNAVNIATGDTRTPEVHNLKDAIYAAAWKLKCDSRTYVDASECTNGTFTTVDTDGTVG